MKSEAERDVEGGERVPKTIEDFELEEDEAGNKKQVLYWISAIFALLLLGGGVYLLHLSKNPAKQWVSKQAEVQKPAEDQFPVFCFAHAQKAFFLVKTDSTMLSFFFPHAPMFFGTVYMQRVYYCEMPLDRIPQETDAKKALLETLALPTCTEPGFISAVVPTTFLEPLYKGTLKRISRNRLALIESAISAAKGNSLDLLVPQ